MPSAAMNLQDDVAEIFDSMSAGEEPADTVQEAPPETADDAATETEADGADETEAEQEARARDESGRFAPKPKEKPAPKPGALPAKLAAAIKPPGTPAGAAAGEVPPLPAAGLALPALKPLQSWKAEAREKWAEVPRWAQEEIHRVGVEYQKQQEAFAQDRKAAGEWREAVAPYEHMARAAGVSAPQMIGGVMQQYAALQTAPLGIRAQILGGLVRNFLGTDEGALKALAAVIDNAVAPAGGAAPAQLGPAQVQAMVQQQLERERAASAQQQIATTIQQFEATQPEFINEVMDDMAAVVRAMASKAQGRPLTIDDLKAAYDKACRMNDGVSKILKQRADAKAAATAKAATQKLKASTTSLKNEPPGPSGKLKKDRTTADDASDAWDELSAKT